MHQALQKGPFGEAMRHASGAGPVAKQSGLRYQHSGKANVTELVEESIRIAPPVPLARLPKDHARV